MTRKIGSSDDKDSDRKAYTMPELLQCIETSIRKAISEIEIGQLEVQVRISGENGLRDIGTFRSNLPGNIHKDTDEGGNYNFGVAC
jgi:hypothetical protein